MSDLHACLKLEKINTIYQNSCYWYCKITFKWPFTFLYIWWTHRKIAYDRLIWLLVWHLVVYTHTYIPLTLNFLTQYLVIMFLEQFLSLFCFFFYYQRCQELWKLLSVNKRYTFFYGFKIKVKLYRLILTVLFLCV